MIKLTDGGRVPARWAGEAGDPERPWRNPGGRVEIRYDRLPEPRDPRRGLQHADRSRGRRRGSLPGVERGARAVGRGCSPAVQAVHHGPGRACAARPARRTRRGTWAPPQ